jgi:hypothetical protein
MTLNPRIQLEMLRRADLGKLADVVDAAEALQPEQLQAFEAMLASAANAGPTVRPGPTAPTTTPRQPMAGERILDFVNSPIGEEVLEGVLMGTVAAAPGFFSQDQDPRETALRWVAGMAGGVGLGIGARRIGAELGARLHPGELTDPTISSLVRLTGQEKMSTGLADTLSDVSARSARMRRSEAAQQIGGDLRSLDDTAFAQAHPDLVAAGIRPSTVSAEDYNRLVNLEAAIGTHAERIHQQAVNTAVTDFERQVADLSPDAQAFLQDKNITADKMRQLAEGSTKPVTGEHLGRALGRAFGDEIGVLLGMGAGTMAASSLGIQSPKDIELQRLRDQLAQRG